MLAVALVAAWCGSAPAQDLEGEGNPFHIHAGVTQSNGEAQVRLSFTVPADHHLYAEKLSFEIGTNVVKAILPAPKSIKDRFNGGEARVFERDFEAVLNLPSSVGADQPLAVGFQGCNEESCFFPQTRRFLIRKDFTVQDLDETKATADLAVVPGGLLDGFDVSRRATGYLDAGRFLQFLNSSEPAAETGDLSSRFVGWGRVLVVGTILLGGLALNLTPCVLPLIPVNLAILGAGAGSKNRRRGFGLGAAYGTGMAAAYGSLGLVVVLTGAKFGTLNSSAGFNFAIAAIFAVLAFSMFDRFAIDFSGLLSRFGGGRPGGNGSFLLAGGMGAVSALLAGACVAPVVISVLLLSSTLHNKGFVLGLTLPFVLGLGMALPWPFAGAGLSFLPKPGAWMVRIKQVFGVLILGFAAWYGYLGVSLSKSPVRVSARNAGEGASDQSGLRELRAALKESRSTGRPLLVDFWASWCKNCGAMEHTTFQDAAVRRQLANFVQVKFQAERLNDPELKSVLDQFGVMGLPTYVVLDPRHASGQVADSRPARTSP
jgi:thiol:disulfide interchange protein